MVNSNLALVMLSNKNFDKNLTLKDNVNSIIKQLANADKLAEPDRQKIVEKADKILKKQEAEKVKTVYSKTSITKPKDPMEAQMSALAADAEKRYR